jgi:hypothetical protein
VLLLVGAGLWQRAQPRPAPGSDDATA